MTMKKRALRAARGHETIDHAADMGICGWGSSPGEAFEETASAMFELMADARGVAPTSFFTVACGADDLEGLLIEFLNVLIGRSDLQGLIPLSVRIARLEERGGRWALDARAGGAATVQLSGRLLTEVKAATYYGARVRQIEGGGWEARCVVDL